MNYVIQKKLELKKTEKQRESLIFCATQKTSTQDAYKQGLSKRLKSGDTQNQQKIFSNKSVEEYFRNIKRFFKINRLRIFPETSNVFLKKKYLGFFLNPQPFFKNKSV